MDNLTIGFLIGTIPIWVIGTAIFSAIVDPIGVKPQFGTSIACAFAIFVLSWWALYFFIKAGL